MNNNMILIEDPDFIPTKHIKNGNFCITGILTEGNCTPCLWFDTDYCTLIYCTEHQEELAKKYYLKNRKVNNNAE